MSEDLHHIDDIFRDAIEPFEENPSPGVWKNLQAQLDRDDATTYKRKYIAVRRVAIILLLLLLSFAIYEAGVKNGPQKLIVKNDISNNRTGIRSDSSSMSNGRTATGNNRTGLSSGRTGVNSDRTEINNEKTGTPNDRTGINNDRTNVDNDETGISNTGTRVSNDGNKPGKKRSKKSVSIEKSDFREQSFTVRRPAEESTATKEINTDKIKPGIGYVAVLPKAVNRVVEPEKKKQQHSFKPYWAVTVNASQEWSEYNLENNIVDNGGNQQYDKSEIAHREKHEPSFTAGVWASYQFKKNWGIQTGLLYSNTSIAIDPQEIYAAKNANGAIAYKYSSSSGYAFVKPNFGSSPAMGDSISTTSAHHNLQYLILPIILKYKMEKKKFSLSPGLGFSINLLSSAKIKTEIIDGLHRQTVDINKLEGTRLFYIGLMANADIQYNFSAKWSFSVMPGFRYALTSITKNAAVKTYPYSFGVGTGINYRF